MRAAARGLRDAVLLTLAITGLGLVFNLFKLLDRRFAKALDSFEATYQFRAGGFAMRLLFSRNRIRVRPGVCGTADYDINFIDLAGALARMAKYPNDMITLIMENKIEQTGNLFFLYKFGYLCGLCESRARRLMSGGGRSLPGNSGL